MKPDIAIDELKQLIDYLSGFTTEDRISRIDHILSQRTRRLAVVLENIYQSHNASAVLRSCDCFGIQDIYTVENMNRLDISKGVTKNAHRWLTLHRFNAPGRDNLADCVRQLKESGYKIAATTPHDSSVGLHNLPVDEPVALMFGAEKEGLSQSAIDCADYKVHIPMFGFSESLNVSVSAGIVLFELVNRLRGEAKPEQWQLSCEEKTRLKADWIRNSIRSAKAIEAAYWRDKPE